VAYENNTGCLHRAASKDGAAAAVLFDVRFARFNKLTQDRSRSCTRSRRFSLALSEDVGLVAAVLMSQHSSGAVVCFEISIQAAHAGALAMHAVQHASGDNEGLSLEVYFCKVSLPSPLTHVGTTAPHVGAPTFSRACAVNATHAMSSADSTCIMVPLHAYSPSSEESTTRDLRIYPEGSQLGGA
jgi:hypothetical protein